jgi:hypothetical protein
LKLIYPIRKYNFFLEQNKYNINENATILHDIYFKYRKKYLAKIYGRKAINPVSLIWGWYWGEVLKNSIKYIKKNGEIIKDIKGISIFKQFMDMIYLSISVPMRPQYYYMHELFYPSNKKNARNYIFRYQVKKIIYLMLVDEPSIGKISPLTDKGKFAEKAIEYKLPIAETICSIYNDVVDYYNVIPKADLFVKPLKGKGGSGVQLWCYLADKDLYHNNYKNKYLSAEKLIKYYLDNSKSKPVVMQAKVTNHRDILDLGCSATSTLRIITILNEKDQPEVVSAILRMSSNVKSIVDNFHKGGIASPVNLEKGIVGCATNLGIKAGYGRIANHPITGALIEGRRLPQWEQVITLAKSAHHVFRPRVIVGWDICITNDGPVIIEGNAQPCVDGVQRVENKPLSSTRFGDLLVFHLLKKYKNNITPM